MTPAEALQVFGDRIHCTYYKNGDFQEADFVYQNVWSSAYGNHGGDTWTYQGTQFLQYTANIEPSTDPQQITFDIQPMYSIYDTTQIHTAICLSTGTTSGLSKVYQSPAWDWYYNGQNHHLENSGIGDSDESMHAFIRSEGQGFSYVCADFTSLNTSSGYSYRATFYGNRANYPCRLLLGLPYVSTDATGENGTMPPESSQPDINVNVSVDMSGVESRLDAVQSGLGDVAERVGDAVDGVNDIKDAINAAQGDSLASVEDVGVPPLPFDESTVDDVGDMLNDVPEEVAAGGFWWSLAFDVLHFSSPYWLIVPLICLLALMRYLLWRG